MNRLALSPDVSATDRSFVENRMSLIYSAFRNRKKVPEIYLRGFLAIFGAYGVAFAAAAAFTVILPMPPVDAAVTAAMLSYFLQTIAILWTFVAKSLQHAILGLGAAAALFGGLYGVAA